MSMDVSELRQVARYRALAKLLRLGGIWSIIFGAIALVVGTDGMQENPINIVLALIGVFMLVEGLWVVRAPTPRGLIAEGLVLLAVGSWNIFITILNATLGAEPSGPWPVLGVFQIIWGIQYAVRYHSYADLPPERPSKESLKTIDELVRMITKAKPTDAEDIIELETASLIARQNWKAKLMDDAGFFVDTRGRDVFVARKENLELMAGGKTFGQKKVKVSLRIDDRRMRGTIKQELLDRYEAWKSPKPVGIA